jgi:hypothetical protein
MEDMSRAFKFGTKSTKKETVSDAAFWPQGVVFRTFSFI